MKKFIVALLALVFLMLVACGGSGSAQGSEAEEPLFERFDTLDGTIIRHNETGVCYLLYYGVNKAGLTLMVNPDGSPYVWEEENE